MYGDVCVFMLSISMNYKLFNRRGRFFFSLSLSLVDGKITAKAMFFNKLAKSGTDAARVKCRTYLSSIHRESLCTGLAGTGSATFSGL